MLLKILRVPNSLHATLSEEISFFLIKRLFGGFSVVVSDTTCPIFRPWNSLCECSMVSNYEATCKGISSSVYKRLRSVGGLTVNSRTAYFIVADDAQETSLWDFPPYHVSIELPTQDISCMKCSDCGIQLRWGRELTELFGYQLLATRYAVWLEPDKYCISATVWTLQSTSPHDFDLLIYTASHHQ